MLQGAFIGVGSIRKIWLATAALQKETWKERKSPWTRFFWSEQRFEPGRDPLMGLAEKPSDLIGSRRDSIKFWNFLLQLDSPMPWTSNGLANNHKICENPIGHGMEPMNFWGCATQPGAVVESRKAWITIALIRMGDWCGSILPHNQHKEKTGANRKCKKEPSFERKKGQAKKVAFFCMGRCFFSWPTL